MEFYLSFRAGSSCKSVTFYKIYRSPGRDFLNSDNLGLKGGGWV